MSATSEAPAPADAAPPIAPLHPFLGGNPSALGLPVFVAGSIVLGLNLIGYTPVAAAGTPLPIIAAGTGIGLLVATLWSAGLGQTVLASIFGVFAALGCWAYLGVAMVSTGGSDVPLGRPVWSAGTP